MLLAHNLWREAVKKSMESSVIEQFHQSIEAKMACGETLAPLIVNASIRVVQQLLQEHKILCCGNGLSASLSNIFTQSLMLQYKMERPGFPAVCLNSNSAILTAIGHHHSISEVFNQETCCLSLATGPIQVIWYKPFKPLMTNPCRWLALRVVTIQTSQHYSVVKI